VQELFIYNPEKAKTLLAEAGYPDGFKTSVVCANTPMAVDAMSTYKAMWAKVGVDLIIDLKELGVYNGIVYGKTAKEMIFATHWAIFPSYLYLGSFLGAGFTNQSRINDPAGLRAVHPVDP